ncbi:MotA/TolQ/ExbB proton channel family protein [Candidatus Poribacteria bacterium]|nr:MotA/TolQ/ExbB proton channel family protein [Candidatus Poribacteria bacterium]
MIDLFQKGGIVMYPLLLCSIAALVIVLWRFFELHRIKTNAGEFMETINHHLGRNEIEEAMRSCERFDGPVVSIVKAGLKKYRKGSEEIAKAIEDAGSIEVAKLEQGMLILQAIGKVSPLLGFYGTVTGMIKSFGVIGRVGIEDPRLVSIGISEALITTAAGLTIAIPVYFAQYYFMGRVGRFVRTMQESSIKLLDAMGELEEKIALRSSQFEEIGGEYLEIQEHDTSG